MYGPVQISALFLLLSFRALPGSTKLDEVTKYTEETNVTGP